ncbi:MAG: pirin family protein [Thermoanaerobaculia bacterium]
MITIRKSEDRGTGRHGWLTTHHTFSFANYYDPKQMGFRALRVINDDTIAAGKGFGAHRHEDMEIVTVVTSGALAHRDSTGGEGVLRPGEVQRMSAGTGVVHSEFNASDDEEAALFQIWIEPARQGIEPGYEQKHFPLEDRRGRLRLVAAPGGQDGALDIHQDARVYVSLLEPGQEVEHALGAGRGAWVHVASGTVEVNGLMLRAGDGAAVENEPSLSLRAIGEGTAEILLFDLA